MIKVYNTSYNLMSGNDLLIQLNYSHSFFYFIFVFQANKVTYDLTLYCILISENKQANLTLALLWKESQHHWLSYQSSLAQWNMSKECAYLSPLCSFS